MGDVWMPDRLITLEVVLGALELLEGDFANTGVAPNCLETCLTGSLIVVGYTAALQGEVIPQIDIGMMRKYWNEGKTYLQKLHMPVTLVGQFKQTSGATRVYIQPLAPVTQSGIQIQLWLGQTIQQYHDAGVETGPKFFRVVHTNKKGPMFQVVHTNKKIHHTTVSHFDGLLHDILKR
ncbi:hypothetical protein ACA910_022244 [Epithemia clementina (nom. ined.)]